MIRWPTLPQPKQAVISISLSVPLSTKELTAFWMKLAIILPPIAIVVGALIGGIVTYLNSQARVLPPKEHIIFNLSTPAYDKCGAVRIDGFIGMPSGSQETITRKFWDWNDGTTGDYSFPAAHVYARNGSYAVKLKAYASNNTTEDQTIPVIVSNAQDEGCQ
jgi:PKD domain-containing protein